MLSKTWAVSNQGPIILHYGGNTLLCYLYLMPISPGISSFAWWERAVSIALHGHLTFHLKAFKRFFPGLLQFPPCSDQYSTGYSVETSCRSQESSLLVSLSPVLLKTSVFHLHRLSAPSPMPSPIGLCLWSLPHITAGKQTPTYKLKESQGSTHLLLAAHRPPTFATWCLVSCKSLSHMLSACLLFQSRE